MAMHDNTTKFRYKEDETIGDATYSELKFTASAGSNKRYYERFFAADSLEDMIVESNQSDATRSPEFKDFIKKSTYSLGEDLPRLLYYPHDLGNNARYKHFIVLNIYQGDSEQVNLSTREKRNRDQAVSAVLARGGNQWRLSDEEINGALIQGGYDPFSKDFEEAKRIYENSVDGITLSQPGFIDSNGIDFGLANFEGGENSGWLQFGGQVLDKAKEEGAEFLQSLVQTTDFLDPKNQTAKNYDQKGISGRKVNRPKNEQNILLANRRFNNANVKTKDTICLYMPQKITFGDQLVYSEEEMGPIKSLSDAITGKRGGLAGLVERGSVKAVTDVILGGLGGLSKITLGLDAVSPVVNLAGDLNFQGARNANTRSSANPRRELLFRDPAIRTHQFSFEFAPKNPTEAETALDIIRLLRYHAYPGLRTGGAFFTFPAEFEMSFYTIDGVGNLFVNDNLPKMPRLALQSINVDYSPTESFKTFPDSKPAFIRLELGFMEMEQLTNEHIIHGF
jgi:hypothetical protein